ncbi:MAG: MFS transporter [Rhizobiaceae bacterium]
MDQTPITSHSDNRFLIVLGASVTQLTTIGLLFSYGLFFKTFETEFGWSRTLLSSCTSVAFLVMGVLAIYGGRLADRYGPRIVLGVTGALGGLGYVLMAQISQPWHLVAIFGLFIGVGMSSHDVVTLSTIARWFDKRRGTMTGIVKVGTAVGQFSVPLIAAFLMINYGWRTALVIMGLSGMVLLITAASLMKNPPLSRTSSNKPVNAAAGTFKEARRTRVFWMLCAMQFLFFPTLTTIPLHIAVHGMDLGMTSALAATLLSTTAVASVFGRVSTGILIDKIGGRNTYIMCLIPIIAALASLMFVTNTTLLYIVIAVYGFGHGGLFTIVSPTIAEYFGLQSLGGLFGTVIFFGTVGGAFGPIFAGYVFDTTQSYFIAFATLMVLTTIALVLAVMLPAPKNTNG